MAYEQYGGILTENLQGLSLTVMNTNNRPTFVASAVSGNREWSFSCVALFSKFMNLG